ncbi:MAG: lysophospholipid acyltransferase family protein [Anaerolineae bacterium]
MPNLRDTINGKGLYLLSQITRRTARFQVSGRHHLEAVVASDKPTIFTTWHGMTMMLVGYFSKVLDLSSIVLLMPDDWRGGALSIFASSLGTTPFPMNLKGESSMATARKLARLVRKVKEGRDCYITPDGPDGPAYVVKPGIAFIAKKAGANILPIGVYARHGYRISRWDRYVVPYPFSRISVVFGEPISVAEDAELEAITEPLTNKLHRVAAQAAANYYEQKP